MRIPFGRALAVLVAVVASSQTLIGSSNAASPTAAPAATVGPVPGCNLGGGVQHVVNIVFDNVHFFRDNPNVPSDLELMPHLRNFIEQNGTMFSNSHTPLIAHTAEDSLAIYTGLYGDRHGMPISNSYRTYNPNGTTNGAGSFVYWTDPNNDGGHDTKQAMIYSDRVPAAATGTNVSTPAPWVPWTRAGCSVGDVSTANMVLENAGFDIPKVFGPSSPETAQLNADSDSFKDPEVADYAGLAVHCAPGDALCTNAQAVKFGESNPSPSAVTDALPDEPGGYTGFQALFGHRYIAPQLGAGTPNLTRNGFPVTNAAGNLVDLNGNQLNGAFLTNHPGFPGFGPIVAPQTLAYTADMLESGVPVVYGYIGDIHERKAGQSGCTTATATAPGNALGPGDSCSAQTAQAYDRAFATFFQRLAAEGITPANTTFVFSAEENDQFAGANVGRAIQSTPANCDGSAGNPCHYAAGQIGEINTNLNGLLAAQKGDTTPFTVEPQGAAIYVNGQPGLGDPATRRLERNVGSLTAPSNPYSGATDEPIAAYLASTTEQQILHVVNADPARTPTFALFPKPDYFFGSTATCTPATQAACASNGGTASRFAWNHGYYGPTIDITWAGFVGPGIVHRGLDGNAPDDGPAVHHPNGDSTVPAESTHGTWIDETDIRPTMLALAGLADDYVPDGRVLSEIVANPNPAMGGPAYVQLAQCYKQLNASVGRFGTSTLLADTAALKSGGGHDDLHFFLTELGLQGLLKQRDQLATQMKGTLHDAAFANVPIGFGTAVSESVRCNTLLNLADHLQ
jgi:hypothetical protein